MNERKKHVIKHAHMLFVEKGYNATSIQDIIEYSGISKGTFYNYFSSKSELLLAVFNMVYIKLDKERNELLVGKDPSDKTVFMQQFLLQLRMNKQNKLLNLFEEIFISNDAELKQYMQRYRFMHLHWVYRRFLDLFGQEKQAYLLDMAILFTGMVHNMNYFLFVERVDSKSVNLTDIVYYCMNRISSIIEDVPKAKEQIFLPEYLNEWIPGCEDPQLDARNKLLYQDSKLKNMIHKHVEKEIEQAKYLEYLDFLLDELVQTKKPRVNIIKSIFGSLKEMNLPEIKQELIDYEQMAEDYLNGK